MAPKLFEGCCTALLTPLKRGKIDYPALKSLLAAQLDAGIDALVACGTTERTPNRKAV